MQTTEHIDDLIEGYALNALEQGEREQVEQHIAICLRCRQLLGKLEDAVHMLGFAAMAASPSVTCKRRVLERVEREQFLAARGSRSRMPGWAMSAWASVATLALVVMSMVAMSGQQQIATTRQELEAVRAESGMLRAQIADRGAVDDMVVDGAACRLGGTGSLPKATALCFLVPGENAALMLVSGLEPLPAGKAYQAWVAKGDEQAPLTVFTAAPEVSTIQVKIVLPKPMDYYENIMVTIEDAPGAQRPSEETVLLGEL